MERKNSSGQLLGRDSLLRIVRENFFAIVAAFA
jgi:hypothetical protein